MAYPVLSDNLPNYTIPSGVNVPKRPYQKVGTNKYPIAPVTLRHKDGKSDQNTAMESGFEYYLFLLFTK